MRLEIVWTILRREWYETFRNRLLMVTILIPPILLTVAPIGLAGAVGDRTLPPELVSAGPRQKPEWAAFTPGELAGAFAVQQFLVFFLLMPAYIPLSIATFSIIGEKQARSLEPVLAAPIRTVELLAGKAIAALVPGVLAGWVDVHRVRGAGVGRLRPGALRRRDRRVVARRRLPARAGGRAGVGRRGRDRQRPGQRPAGRPADRRRRDRPDHRAGAGPGERDDPRRARPATSCWPSSCGFFTVSISYRLSGQATFPAQIEDCKAAVRWLRAHAADYHVDPARIGVWGHSAGAHLAALLGTSGDVPALEGTSGNAGRSSRVQAVVALAPPVDLGKMGGWHDAPDSPEARLLGGPVWKRPDGVRVANPITYLKRTRRPSCSSTATATRSSRSGNPTFSPTPCGARA